MSMKNILVFIMILCVIPTVAFSKKEQSSHDSTLLGYSLGMSWNDAVNMRSTFAPSDDPPDGVKTAVVDEFDVGGTQFKVYLYSKGDTLQGIDGYFSPDDFDKVSSALQEKHGKGNKKNSVIKTKMGVTYHQTEITWTFSNGQKLILKKYSKDIETSNVCLMSSKLLKSIYKESYNKYDKLKEGL